MVTDSVLSIGGSFMTIAFIIMAIGGIRMLWGAIRAYNDNGMGFLSGCMILSCGLLLTIPFVVV